MLAGPGKPRRASRSQPHVRLTRDPDARTRQRERAFDGQPVETIAGRWGAHGVNVTERLRARWNRYGRASPRRASARRCHRSAAQALPPDWRVLGLPPPSLRRPRLTWVMVFRSPCTRSTGRTYGRLPGISGTAFLFGVVMGRTPEARSPARPDQQVPSCPRYRLQLIRARAG